MTPSKTKTPLPTRLRKARIRAGLTQAEAAALAGTHRVNVVKVETGNRPSPTIERRLARALGIRVTLSDLYPEDTP
jgi:DNA-binding XRE family transcriptional regulator